MSYYTDKYGGAYQFPKDGELGKCDHTWEAHQFYDVCRKCGLKSMIDGPEVHMSTPPAADDHTGDAYARTPIDTVMTPTGRLVWPDGPAGAPPPAQELPVAAQAASHLLRTLDSQLNNKFLSPTEQISVALRLATLAAGRMPELAKARGRIINAMCDDFRRNLQKFLPL